MRKTSALWTVSNLIPGIKIFEIFYGKNFETSLFSHCFGMSKFIHFSIRSLNQSPTVESISSGYTLTGKKVWKADRQRWLNWSEPASQKYGQNSSNISRVALAFNRFKWDRLWDWKKHLPLVRLELTTSASLYVYKYSALTDCATGALVLQAQIVDLI